MVSAVFHTPLDAAPHADKPATNSIAPSALSMSATAQNASKTAATTSTKASGRDLATWSRNFWMAVLPPACGVALLLVAWAMVIGGFWMIVAESFAARQPDRAMITLRVAIAVGLAQVVAGVFPGTSRSAATIFVAMLLGTSNRAAATEFAFLVGIPTMFAASGYQLLKQMHGGPTDMDWLSLGIAFVVSTITAFVTVKWLLTYIRSHRFTAFAIYRIVFGGLLLALAAAGIVA